VIFLTSNLGSSQIADLMHGGMGFIQPKDKSTGGLDEKVERTAVEAARRKFSPEFMNRLDKVVVFHPLKRAELDEVLEIELRQVQKRVLDSTTRPFMFRITDEARKFLLEEGTDQRYGARHLKRAIEHYVVYPIARLLATTQLHQGDVLLIDWHRGEEGLVFLRDTEKRSSGSKIDFPVPSSGQLISAEVRV
jgi:ATP-dependent Clp protease ATP-binding subunit ClpB